jgi:hypothetical protein
MSRSGYTDECESNWDWIRWEGARKAAIRGRRGQQFFRDLIAALDAMPEKALIAEELELDGQVCALGALGRQRGMALQELDPEDPQQVAAAFGISQTLARETVYINDEDGPREDTPERRWKRVREWAERQLLKPQQEAA